MPTRNISLTERQDRFVDEVVNAGEYQSASELMREGLRLVEERRAITAAKLEALRAALELGEADIDASRVTYVEPHEIRDYVASLGHRLQAPTTP